MPQPLPPADLDLGQLAVRNGQLTQSQLRRLLDLHARQPANGPWRSLGVLAVESELLTAKAVDELRRQLEASWEGRRIVGHYRLEKKLGEGGMGAVWKATHVDLGSTVAIKLLPFGGVENAALLERFQRETRILATLNHTNIVQAFDAGQDAGLPYYVMPYFEGATLREILTRRSRLGVRTSLSIALQVVRGLGYAHQLGLVHRDLKPENLYLTHDGTAKILDLGLSKLTIGDGPLAQHVTRIGLVVGTPVYMPPEQIMGDPNLDGRADIYSLACTLFEMLSGRQPYAVEGLREQLRVKLEQAPPDLRQYLPDAPPAVAELLMQMLAVKPTDRPADCAAVEALVEALLEGKPITGPSLAPGNIVLGQSERAGRGYTGGPVAEGLLAAAVQVSAHAPTLAGRPVAVAETAAPAEGAPAEPAPPVPAPATVQPPSPTLPARGEGVLPPRAGGVREGAETRERLPAPQGTPAVPAPEAAPPQALAEPVEAPPHAAGWLAQLTAAVVLVLSSVAITVAVVVYQPGAVGTVLAALLLMLIPVAVTAALMRVRRPRPSVRAVQPPKAGKSESGRLEDPSKPRMKDEG